MPIGKTKAETQIDNQSTVSGAEGHFLQSDGSVGMEAPLRMKGNAVEGVATPVNGTDAANKAYVDSVASGPGTDELAKVTVNDTTPGVLADKIVAGSNVTLSVLNPGADERLEITSSGGGGGTGTAGRVDHLVSLRGRVPNSGTAYLFIGDVSLLDAPVNIDVAGTLAGASITVNSADTSRDYLVEALVNGTVVESLLLPSGSTSAQTSGFSAAVSAGDKVSARLRRTSGSGRSDFTRTTLFLKLTED